MAAAAQMAMEPTEPDLQTAEPAAAEEQPAMDLEKLAALSRAEKDMALYEEWRKHPTKHNMDALLRQLDPLITTEVTKQMGSVAVPTLRAQAKNFAIKAIKTYKPDQGAKLSTHVVNYLKQLRRVNYQYQNLIRLPENRQIQVQTYRDAKQELSDKFRRDPTVQEMADHLMWPIKEVGRMEKELHIEVPESQAVYEPAFAKFNDELDRKLDYVYFSLDPRDKIIFEHLTGYGNKPKLSVTEIASKLKVTPSLISQRKQSINRLLQRAGIYGTTLG